MQAQTQHQQDHAMALHMQQQEIAAANTLSMPQPAPVQGIPSEPGKRLNLLFNCTLCVPFWKGIQAYLLLIIHWASVIVKK